MPAAREGFSARHMGAVTMLAGVVALASLTAGSLFSTPAPQSAPPPLLGPEIAAFRPVNTPSGASPGMIALLPGNLAPQTQIDPKPTGSIAPVPLARALPHVAPARKRVAQARKPVRKPRQPQKNSL